MAPLLAVGAGANEGLDTMLNRMMLEDQMAESARKNRAGEALQSRALDQGDWVKGALADERQAKIDQMTTAASDEADRKKREDELLKDPTLAGKQRSFLRMRSVLPKGENIPYQVFDEGGDQKYNGEEKTKKITDPTLASSLGRKVGDVIDVILDPRTKRYSYRGQDVTEGVDHYEKPPTPDRVLIQTGTGYETREDARKKLAAGGTVPLATTSTTRTMMEGANMLEPHITALGDQADELDKAGLFGPVMSRIRNLATKVGTVDEFTNAIGDDPELSKDPAVGRFATSLGLLATGAARVHGGARGGGSPQMLQHFKQILSDASTSRMFKGRLSALDDYMRGYAAGPQGPDSQSTAPGGLPSVGSTFQGGKVLSVTPIQQ